VRPKKNTAFPAPTYVTVAKQDHSCIPCTEFHLNRTVTEGRKYINIFIQISLLWLAIRVVSRDPQLPNKLFCRSLTANFFHGKESKERNFYSLKLNVAATTSSLTTVTDSHPIFMLVLYTIVSCVGKEGCKLRFRKLVVPISKYDIPCPSDTSDSHYQDNVL